MSTGDTMHPLAIAKTLGPKTPFLDHLVRFLNSVRGTDKVLMFIQYFSKILIWYLRRRSTAIKTVNVQSLPLDARITNLAGPIADFRILLRYYGLLPMIQYMNQLEHSTPPSALHLELERWANLFNVCYYPLEHLYWLGSHGVIPMKENTTNRIGIWSCRFWAAAVILELARLWEQYRLWLLRKRAVLKRFENEEEVANEMKSLETEKKQMLLNTVINASYLPLTAHWSIESGLISDVWVGIFGTVASVCQLYTAWKASA
ncbi:uncharacterized protein VTP21DRAFT_10421 [Calcarisporiella thermophila]|uniref:uncharacterized protein n=1 Tax=Calcarisporiella thermophila TaxID=911321 RepID=UPI0037428BED